MNYDDLSPDILVERRDHTLLATFNRPDQLNAIGGALHDAIMELFARLHHEREAKVVVLTGAGRAFSAGGDRDSFIQSYEDAEFRRYSIRMARAMLESQLTVALPIIAAVNGPAVGLGCSIALTSDLVILSERGFLSDPHIDAGLVAGDGGAVLWPHLIGHLRAKEFLFLGTRVSGEEAVSLGLANRIVAPDEVLATALELAAQLAKRPAQALQDTKRAINLHLQHASLLVAPFALAAESESFGTDDLKRLSEDFRR